MDIFYLNIIDECQIYHYLSRRVFFFFLFMEKHAPCTMKIIARTDIISIILKSFININRIMTNACCNDTLK
jgi:hypothetical protein